MDELALMAGEEELPKGGGELATECAKRIAERLGKEELRKFVKVHFANYLKLL
jgi:ribonuclease HIII